jgi:hypothetical protein
VLLSSCGEYTTPDPIRLCHFRDTTLALRAHRVFYDFPSVGWDVAVTPEGPVLIEGNYNWNVVLTQQAGGRAIGETGYFDIYLSFLD